MSEIYQIVNQEGKRMAVWSKRDLEYMQARGWKLYTHPKAEVSKDANPKKRGRPKKDN